MPTSDPEPLASKKTAALAKVIEAEHHLALTLEANKTDPSQRIPVGEGVRRVKEAEILLEEAERHARLLDSNCDYEVKTTERGTKLRACVLSAVNNLTTAGAPFAGGAFARVQNSGPDNAMHGATVTLPDKTEIVVWVQVLEKNS